MPTEKETESLMLEIGCALITCQFAERYLAKCVASVFETRGTTREEEERLFERPDRLENLIRKTRDAVDLPDDFTNIMWRFRENRNKLVHKLTPLDGADWHTDAGFKSTMAFVRGLRADAALVRDVLWKFLETLIPADMLEDVRRKSDWRIDSADAGRTAD